jgi:hypothetical protein
MEDKEMSATEKEKAALLSEIQQSVHEVANEKRGLKLKCLSVYDPAKVAKLLYLYSTGSSQTRLVRHYGFERDTVISVLADYADHMGTFKELSGRIAAKNYLNLSSLEEDLIDKVRDRLENDPEMEVGFKDIKELSIAKSNASREAMTARGEATHITEERKVYTQDDYEATIAAARKRIEEAKVADIIEIQDEDNN